MSEIGETLRERRMSLKIDVHEVEEATKIRAKYLRALENEEYSLLPGQAYVKSFLRTYADYLGLDSREIVDLYRVRGEQVDEDSISVVSSTDHRKNRRWIAVVAVVAVILLLLFVIGVLGGGGGQS